MAEVTTSDSLAEAAAAKPKKTETAGGVKKYKCVKKCYFNEKLYFPGDIVETASKVPEHFSEVR